MNSFPKYVRKGKRQYVGATAPPPRPWMCNRGKLAIYCPLHGDCICSKDEFGRYAKVARPTCPLHGKDSEHPNVVEMVQ